MLYKPTITVPECRVLKDLNQDYISIYCMLSNNYNNTSLEALGALAQRLQHVTACNTSSPCPLNPKWPTESGNRLNLRLLDPPINFRKISFLIRSFLLGEHKKSKMADRVWKRVYPKVFWRSCQLSQKKFFDPSTPSMRKVEDGEKEKRRCQSTA